MIINEVNFDYLLCDNYTSLKCTRNPVLKTCIWCDDIITDSHRWKGIAAFYHFMSGSSHHRQWAINNVRSWTAEFFSNIRLTVWPGKIWHAYEHESEVICPFKRTCDVGGILGRIEWHQSNHICRGSVPSGDIFCLELNSVRDCQGSDVDDDISSCHVHSLSRSPAQNRSWSWIARQGLQLFKFGRYPGPARAELVCQLLTQVCFNGAGCICVSRDSIFTEFQCCRQETRVAKNHLLFENGHWPAPCVKPRTANLVAEYAAKFSIAT